MFKTCNYRLQACSQVFGQVPMEPSITLLDIQTLIQGPGVIHQRAS